MIELANAPSEGRTSQRSSQDEGKGSASFDSQRARTGHAWPFLSSYAAKPSASSRKPSSGNSGS